MLISNEKNVVGLINEITKERMFIPLGVGFNISKNECVNVLLDYYCKSVLRNKYEMTIYSEGVSIVFDFNMINTFINDNDIQEILFQIGDLGLINSEIIHEHMVARNKYEHICRINSALENINKLEKQRHEIIRKSKYLEIKATNFNMGGFCSLELMIDLDKKEV